MERKCECYRVIGSKSVCYGTKEIDPCSCGGDKARCDFYPKYRTECTGRCTADKDNKAKYVRVTMENNGSYIKELEKSVITKNGEEIGFVEKVTENTVVMCLKKNACDFSRRVSMELKGEE